ncbi:hypothetical protein ACTPEF_24835, partial [Clostridioides difficile]
SVDLKEMTKLSREPLIAIFVAVLTVSIMAFLFGLVFAEKISEANESENYNKKGQISFNADTFSKALIDDSDKVYKTLAGYSSNYD